MAIKLNLFLLFFLLVSCGSNGLYFNKSEAFEYLSKNFNKSKKWFKSTDGEAVSEDGPPPPSKLQPTEKAVIRKRANQIKNQGMSKDDYQRAIQRLEKSIPELEQKFGPQSMEVGETYYTIGAMHLMQGNSKTSKNAYTKALKIFSSWLGAEHPRVWKLNDRINKIKDKG